MGTIKRQAIRKYIEIKRRITFFCDDQGQDLIEYTLILAFVTLGSAALFMGAGGSVSGVWGNAADVLWTGTTQGADAMAFENAVKACAGGGGTPSIGNPDSNGVHTFLGCH